MQAIPTDASSFYDAVRYKKLDDRALTPEYQTEGAAGFDLGTLDDVEVLPGQTVAVPTGLVIAAPEGTMLMIAPRSSTWKKWGVRLGNTVGIVDEDYCGDDDQLMLSLWNPSTTAEVVIPGATRIAQGIFVPVHTEVYFVRQEKMGRSRGGWGSTG